MHLVPLTRNQLTDLEGLLRAVLSSCASRSASKNAEPNGFTNVFALPECISWNVQQKATYCVWWSHRPQSCRGCGAQDSWAVSCDDEYVCGVCTEGAGSTATHDTVEERWGMEDDEDSDDDQPMHSRDVEHSGAVSFFSLALQWLVSLPQIIQETVPTGEALCRVCRIAWDIASLYLLPGSAAAVKEAALFLALTAAGSPVPFPVFLLGSDSVDKVIWADIELMAAQTKVSLVGFFETPTVSGQFLQNAATILAHFGVPSVLWCVDRAEGRAAYVAGLQQSQKRSLSAEHVAAVVCCELARQYEEQHNPLLNDANDRRIYDWYYRWYLSVPTGALSVLKDVETSGPPLALMPSRLAELLVKMFAQAFVIPCLEMLEMVEASGLYKGETHFLPLLERCAKAGIYHAMPIAQRQSPFYCPWSPAFSALYSEDRLPLLAALQQATLASTKEQQGPLHKLIQRIMRKHDPGTRIQSNFGIRCSDPDKQHMQGLYVLQEVAKSCAVFVCAKTGKKTLTFNTATRKVSLCNSGDTKERVVDYVDVRFVGPVTVTVESEAAKYFIDSARSGLNAAAWNQYAAKSIALSHLRRRMRDPSLYPLWGLSSARELLARAPAESIDSLAAQVNADTCSQRLETDLLALPRPSLAAGHSDLTIVSLYCDLVALAEAAHPLLKVAPGEHPASVERRLTGECLRKRIRIEDADACQSALQKTWRSLSGVDIEEKGKQRVARRHRREEERKKVPSLFADEWDALPR